MDFCFRISTFVKNTKKDMKSQLMKALRALGIIPFFLMSVVACSDENESLPAPEDPEAETEVNVVDIDWDKTQLTGYDEVSGRMTLQFSGEMPRWNEGRSLMVVATDRITAVRRVMKVAGQDGQNVTLETRRASMADLFPGQSLRLSFEEAGQPQATRTADGALLPVEVEVMTANGYRTVYEAGQVTRAAASPDDYLDLTAHQAFFEVKVDTAEVYLDTLHAWSPVIEQFLFKAGLYGTFSFDFDLGEKEIAPGLVVPQGKLLTCNYLLSSRATLEMRIRQRVEQEYAVELQRTLLPRLTPTMRFQKGYVLC